MTLVLGLMVVLVPAVLTVAAADAASNPEARTDGVSMVAGSKTRVAVLANDRVARKGKAAVRVTKVPAGFRVKVVKRVVKVAASLSAAPGVYRGRYKVTDTRGRRTGAAIKVTITPAQAGPITNTLRALVASLLVSAERRDGYDRDLFRHWNTSLNPGDRCDTRHEVLVSEAVTATTVGASCTLSGGSRYSYYDGVTTTDPSSLDIDHLVPLAEA